MEMCHYEVPEAGVRDLEVTGIQDRADEVRRQSFCEPEDAAAGNFFQSYIIMQSWPGHR